jgi:hypothetical protein
MPITDQSTQTQIPCSNLRSKEMFHDASDTDEYSSGLYWCAVTRSRSARTGNPWANANVAAGVVVIYVKRR